MEDTTERKLISKQELISANIDEELDEFEQRRLDQLLHEEGDDGTWGRYQLISDVLQGHFPQRIRKDFSAGVMAGLCAEQATEGIQKTVSSPVRSRIKQGLRFAIAASVAVVAIVVVQQVRVDDTAVVEELAIAQPASQNVPQIATVAVEENARAPLQYSSASTSVNAQLVETSQPAVVVKPAMVNGNESDNGDNLRMLDPYMINHAAVASERVITPYLESVGSSAPEQH